MNSKGKQQTDTGGKKAAAGTPTAPGKAAESSAKQAEQRTPEKATAQKKRKPGLPAWIKPAALFLAVIVLLLNVLQQWDKVGQAGQTPTLQAQEEGTLREIAVAGMPAELFLGEQVECGVSTKPSRAECSLSWHSSDEGVVRVEGGVITAQSEGQATLTVRDELTGISGEARVTVTGDFSRIATAALEHIVASPTDAAAADAVRAQQQRMEACGQQQAQETAAALRALLDCADGVKQCSFAELEEPLGLAGDTLRLAAESIRMRGQMSSDTVTLSFTGDCTFGYNNEYDIEKRFPAVYKKSGSVTYPFDKVKHIFAADDLTVINYEATLADKGSEMADKKYHLRGEPGYVKILSGSSVEVANLSNNHTYDYKTKGFEQTAERLSDEGITVLHTDSPVIQEVDGIQVVLVSAGHWKFPTSYSEQVEEMLQQVKEYKKPENLVIVSLHWGGEYVTTPEDGQIEAAHSLIDAGADMIVCHHAHIIQSIELYKDKVIAYGLGNFSFGGTQQLKEKESFILRASFGKDEKGRIEMKQWWVIPCHATGTGTLDNDFQPTPLHGEQAQAMLKVLLSRSKSIGGCSELPACYFEY